MNSPYCSPLKCFKYYTVNKFLVACATFQIITATMPARVLGITSGTSTTRMLPPCYRRGLHADAEVDRWSGFPSPATLAFR